MYDKVRKLIVVENVHKARTIKKIIPSLNGKFDEWKVFNTKGHLLRTPPWSTGVDTNKFELLWSPKNKTIIKSMKETLLSADYMYIATDEDPEGEELAQHIRDLAFEHSNARVYRLCPNEITLSGIKKSLNSSQQILNGLVRYHRSRIFFDRMADYTTSLNTKPFGKDVYIHLLYTGLLFPFVYRKRKHRNFIPKTTYVVEAKTNNYATVYSKPFDNYIEAEKLLNYLVDSNYNLEVDYSVTKDYIDSPDPFTTNSLLKFVSMYIDPLRIQKGLKSLFGKGLISFYYVDDNGVHLEDDYEERFWDFLKDDYTEELRERPSHRYINVNEAIRPINISLTPIEAANQLKGDALELYRIIWRRTACTQGLPLVVQKQSVEYYFTSGNLALKGEKEFIEEQGWFRIADNMFAEITDSFGDLRKNTEQKLGIQKATIIKVDSSTPLSYTFKEFIELMEENGIGDIYYYLPILETLVEQGFLEVINKGIIATEKADRLVTWIEDNDIPISLEISSQIEDELYEIKFDNKIKTSEIIKKYWQLLETTLHTKLKEENYE